MRTRRLLALGVAILWTVGPASAAAQDASPLPEPPPWLGGRVEMPEHGFAVTLPDDWVAFDPAVDVASQVEAASDVLDSSVWFDDVAWLPDMVVAARAQGQRLMAFHTSSEATCLFTGAQVWPVREAAEAAHQWFVDDPRFQDVEPPQRIDLPSGPAYHIRMSTPFGPDTISASTYVLSMSEGALGAQCSTYDERPEDDWQSIVETIEQLPAE